MFLYLKPLELIPYYNAADLCVHAAEVEVECMSVLEEMGCGCPCLIARAPKSATAQFTISADFLFQHGSLEELSPRLDYWLDHPAERREAGHAYRRAAERYRIELSVEKLLAVYRAVTAPGTRTGRQPQPLPPPESTESTRSWTNTFIRTCITSSSGNWVNTRGRAGSTAAIIGARRSDRPIGNSFI